MNPLNDWTIIPKNEVRELSKDYPALEQEFRRKKQLACYEFYDRADKVADTKQKIKIMQEVAAKYGFNEKWFIEQIKF